MEEILYSQLKLLKENDEMKKASGVATRVSRSRKEAREEAVRIAICEVIQKVAESLTARLQVDLEDSMTNNVMKKIMENPYSFVSNFRVIDEHEDMVMDEIWVTVEVEVDEELLKKTLSRELK